MPCSWTCWHPASLALVYQCPSLLVQASESLPLRHLVKFKSLSRGENMKWEDPRIVGTVAVDVRQPRFEG